MVRKLSGLLLLLPLFLVANLFLALFAPTIVLAATRLNYYVSITTGDDKNDGLSVDKPLKTPQKAADRTNPGDTVYIMNGTYRESSVNGILFITRSGAPGAYITYKAYPGHHPVFRAEVAYSHINLVKASYIKIEDFEIFGNTDNITYEEAYANQGKSAYYTRLNTSCINLAGSGEVNAPANTIVHHIEIRNTILHKCPGAGIGTGYTDYLTIEDNIVYSNCWRNWLGTSGISIFHSRDIDDNTGYKNFIRRNITYDNENFIPWSKTGQISDGNGIIIDSNQNQDNDLPPYIGRTLVENNISYNNGGSGMHSYKSSHVDIINNTAYLNSRSPALNYPSISAISTDDAKILNNLLYVRAGESAFFNGSNTNTVYDFNIYFNGKNPSGKGANDLIADPKFVDPDKGDFRVQAGSPAIDSGTNNLFALTDIKGVLRPQGSAVDRGAYETANALPPSPPSGNIKLLPDSYRLAQTFDPNGLNYKTKLTSSGLVPTVGNTSTVQLTARGLGGIPADATGLFGVLTNVGCANGANFRLWVGTTPPNAANLNIPGANPALNLSTGFTVPLDKDGKFYLGIGSGNLTTCGFVVDVAGYLSDSGDNLSLLPASYRIAQTISPTDSNNRPKLTAQGITPQVGSSATIQISARGQGNIPTNATGIIGVLTNVGCNTGANFRFWTGTTAPNAVNLNIPGASPGLNLSTNFIAPLDSEGKVYLGLGSGTTAECGYVVDIVGYLAPGGSGKVNLLFNSTRLAQTNNPNGANLTNSLTAQGVVPGVGNDSTLLLGAGGNNGIPPTAKGIIGVLTNVGCNNGGNFRFWVGTTAPNAANLNVPGVNPALNLSTGFVAPLDSLGKTNLGLGSGAATNCGYVLDISGYLS